jgi:Coenzyme PQQ synthesis protein D (PqqD)
MPELRSRNIETYIKDIRPKRRCDVKARDMEGELVVLDLESKLVHQLNRTARHVWNKCDGQHSVADIIEQLCESFDVDLITAEKDVTALVRQLEEAGLLQKP